MLYRYNSSQVVVTRKKLTTRSVAFCRKPYAYSEEHESLARSLALATVTVASFWQSMPSNAIRSQAVYVPSPRHRPTTFVRRALPIRWRPHAYVIAPSLKLNRHVRKSLHDAHLAPRLSATPERAYDEHEIHETQVDQARDANPRSSACLSPEGLCIR